MIALVEQTDMIIRENAGLSKLKNCPVCKGFIHPDERCYRNKDMRRHRYYHEQCLRRKLRNELKLQYDKLDWSLSEIEEALEGHHANEHYNKMIVEYYELYRL